MLHLCLLSYQKTTSSTGTKATCWEEHIYLHDVCLAQSLKPQLYSWRWFSRFGRMVVKIDCQVLSQLLKAASSKHCSWWFLSSLIIFRDCSSLCCHPLVCAWVWSPWLHPTALSALAVFSSPLCLSWLWPHGLCDPFGPPLSLKKDAARTAPSLGDSRRWTLWREDLWCFLSFRAKEYRLIKTSELSEVLATASHIGFIGWILLSLGFQIFLSYYFSCHILTVSSVIHSLLVPALWKNFSTVLHFISTIIISGFPVRHSELVWGTEKWKSLLDFNKLWMRYFSLMNPVFSSSSFTHFGIQYACEWLCVCDLHLLDFRAEKDTNLGDKL